MPYNRIWVHLVWATKERKPLLTKKIRQQVFEHIKENAKKKDIYLDHINGHKEHVHCLISLQAEQNIATVVQLLKGESSFWINKQKLTSVKFGWQDEYFSVSSCESQVENLRNYIRKQEEHHKKKTYTDEYNEFIKKYGFEIIQKDKK